MCNIFNYASVIIFNKRNFKSALTMCQKFTVQLNSKAIRNQNAGQNIHELEVCDESSF